MNCEPKINELTLIVCGIEGQHLDQYTLRRDGGQSTQSVWESIIYMLGLEYRPQPKESTGQGSNILNRKGSS